MPITKIPHRIRERIKNNTSKEIDFFETKWYTEVVDYLYNPESKDKTDIFRKDSFVGRYRAYNAKTRFRDKHKAGACRINDIWLNVPPSSISITKTKNSIDIPQIRSKHSVKMETGYGEVSMSMDITFSGNPLAPDNHTLGEEITYKLIPLLTQIKQIPFVEIENEYIYNEVYAAPEGNPARELNRSIMFSYVNHSISTSPDSPDMIVVSFNFLLFNHSPFMKKMGYVEDYLRDEWLLIARSPIDNRIINPPNATTDPYYSYPFYELHAKEFQRVENIIKDTSGAYRNEYHHDFDKQQLELVYYTYLEIPRELAEKNFSHKMSKVRDFKEIPIDIHTPDITYRGEGVEYVSIVQNMAAKYNIDPILMFAQIKQESNFNPNAVSHAGAKGLSQFMPGTWGHVWGDEANSKSPYTPKNSIEAQARYMQSLYKYFSKKLKNKDDINELVLAAYNWGNGNVMKAIETSGSEKWNNIKNKVPMETKNYVKNILKYKREYEAGERRSPFVKEKLRSTEPFSITEEEVKEMQMAMIKAEAMDRHIAHIQKYGKKKFTTPLDIDHKKYAENARKRVWEEKVVAYVDSLRDAYEVVMPNNTSSTVFVRIKNYHKVKLGGREGLNIVGIEVNGGHNMSRIPISGYKYSTHQYLGGHVEKLAITFIADSERGHSSLQSLESILDLSSDNARQYKSVAALDGINIKNRYINAVMSSSAFVYDDIQVSTHPDIPGGSVVTISFTDYSKVKDHIYKAMGFNAESRIYNGTSEDQMLKELFDEIMAKANPYLYKIVYVEAEYNRNYTVEPILKLTFKHMSQYFESNAFTSVINQLFEAISSIDIDEGVSTFFDLNKYVSETKYIRDKEAYKILVDKKLLDPKVKGRDTALHAIIKNWLIDNFDILRENTKDFKQKYSPKAVKELEQIHVPAYLDFDLPPTIDPDYYYYQPDKYAYRGYKLSKKIEAEEIIHMHNEYKRNLTVHNMDSDQIDEDSILYRLVGQDKEMLKSMRHGYSVKSMDENGKEATLKGDDYSNKFMSSRINNINTRAYPDDMRPLYEACGMEDIDEDKLKKLKEEDKYQKFKNAIIDKTLNGGNERGSLSYVNMIEGEDDNGNFLNEIYTMKAEENRLQQETNSMSRCFPVFKVYIIEEDDQDFSAPIRKDLNELYGLNSVVEIRSVQHGDQPADMMTIKFVDLSGRFTSAKFKERPFTETSDLSKRDIVTEDGVSQENPLEGIMMRDGTRIQVRMGYSNNINNLTTVFNGKIVSISDQFNEFIMVCQSHGTELVYQQKFPDSPTDPSTFNADTAEMINWALNQPEVKNFGKWKLSDPANLQLSDSRTGVNIGLKGNGMGSYIRKRPDGRSQRVWTWAKEQSDLNILCPIEGMAQMLSSNFSLNNLAGMNFWETVGSMVRETWRTITLQTALRGNIDYYVYKQTPWEVIDEMTYRYPGSVARVVPYGDRSTLFFGPPDAPYYFRPTQFSNIKDFSQFKKRAEEVMEVLKDIDSDINSEILEINTMGTTVKRIENSYIRIPNVINSKSSINRIKNKIDKHTKRIEKSLRPYYKYLKEGMESTMKYHKVRLKDIRPFRNYWKATSENNIIKNNIVADYRDSYNEIIILRSNAGVDRSGLRDVNELSHSTKMKLNDFLQDEDTRTKIVAFPNVQTVGGYFGGAYRYGTHQLQREAKKLYKGNLHMIGDPAIKPTDLIYMWDDHTQTYGPIEVVQHVITIAPGEGMTSSVTPGLYSQISDLVGLSVFDAWSKVQAFERANNLIEGSHWLVNTFNPNLLMGVAGLATASSSVVAGLAAAGVTLAFSPLAIPIMFFTGVAFATLSIKIMSLAQYRSPILLQPLIRNGVPFLMGNNTYKTGTLTKWIDKEYKLFTDGLDEYEKVLSSAITEAWSSI